MTNNMMELSLLKSLNAYVKNFEVPNNREDLLAIASSILTFQQKQGSLEIKPYEVELLVQSAVDQFSASSFSHSITDLSTELFVKEVYQWQKSLESQVLNTISAYVQNFLPDQPLNLPETILSIIPLVEDVKIHWLEAKSLIQQITSKFDLTTALSHIASNDSIAIAQRLVESLQFGNIEELLKTTILNNQPLLDRTLEGLTESIVNDELEKIIGDKSIEVNVDFKEIMVKQVTLKLNVMRSSPAPSKSNEEICNQMNSEIDRFKAGQKVELKISNLFTSGSS